MSQEPVTYPAGSRVRKVGGDYSLTGTVAAAFHKRSGVVRYVVEADHPAGLLMIYREEQLLPADDD